MSAVDKRVDQSVCEKQQMHHFVGVKFNSNIISNVAFDKDRKIQYVIRHYHQDHHLGYLKGKDRNNLGSAKSDIWF